MANRRTWWVFVLAILALLGIHAWISHTDAQDTEAKAPTESTESETAADAPAEPDDAKSKETEPEETATGLSPEHKWSLFALAA